MRHAPPPGAVVALPAPVAQAPGRAALESATGLAYGLAPRSFGALRPAVDLAPIAAPADAHLDAAAGAQEQPMACRNRSPSTPERWTEPSRRPILAADSLHFLWRNDSTGASGVQTRGSTSFGRSAPCTGPDVFVHVRRGNG